VSASPSAFARKKQQAKRGAIVAAIIGDDTANAEGVTVTSPSPVLSLCRALVNAGFDPTTPLHAYRRDVLCLRVRAIGEAAELEVGSNGIGFIRRPARLRAGPPVRVSRRARAEHRPDRAGPP
jgi:hypothetical protein